MKLKEECIIDLHYVVDEGEGRMHYWSALSGKECHCPF